MKIRNIDHFVITTSDLKACLDFYVGLLGMEHRENDGNHNLYSPMVKSQSIQGKVSFCQPQ